jgi:hypothetical protein
MQMLISAPQPLLQALHRLYRSRGVQDGCSINDLVVYWSDGRWDECHLTALRINMDSTVFTGRGREGGRASGSRQSSANFRRTWSMIRAIEQLLDRCGIRVQRGFAANFSAQSLYWVKHDLHDKLCSAAGNGVIALGEISIVPGGGGRMLVEYRGREVPVTGVQPTFFKALSSAVEALCAVIRGSALVKEEEREDELMAGASGHLVHKRPLYSGASFHDQGSTVSGGATSSAQQLEEVGKRRPFGFCTGNSSHSSDMSSTPMVHSLPPAQLSFFDSSTAVSHARTAISSTVSHLLPRPFVEPRDPFSDSETDEVDPNAIPPLPRYF